MRERIDCSVAAGVERHIFDQKEKIDVVFEM